MKKSIGIISLLILAAILWGCGKTADTPPETWTEEQTEKAVLKAAKQAEKAGSFRYVSAEGRETDQGTPGGGIQKERIETTGDVRMKPFEALSFWKLEKTGKNAGPAQEAATFFRESGGKLRVHIQRPGEDGAPASWETSAIPEEYAETAKENVRMILKAPALLWKENAGRFSYKGTEEMNGRTVLRLEGTIEPATALTVYEKYIRPLYVRQKQVPPLKNADPEQLRREVMENFQIPAQRGIPGLCASGNPLPAVLWIDSETFAPVKFFTDRTEADQALLQSLKETAKKEGGEEIPEKIKILSVTNELEISGINHSDPIEAPEGISE